MSLLNHTSITWINRPYFDLGTFDSGSWHLMGIEYCYKRLIDNTMDINPVTLIHPISFRKSLIRESKLFQYCISNPLQLVPDLRTERWIILCEYLDNYQNLQSNTQLIVVNLLSSLCLHEAVLEYIPAKIDTDISHHPDLASLAYSRAMSKLMIQPNTGTLENLKEFENIVVRSLLGSKVRFGSIIQLVALFGKTFRDLESTEYWRAEAAQELDRLKSSVDDFTLKRLTSVYYRAAVFAPILRKNKKIVIQEMDLCESLAEELIHESKNNAEKLVAHENLTTVFESRTKEALWLGDIDLAEERAKKMIKMEPLYSRYYLQLGEVLIKQGKVEEASKIYRSAARLGPPGTPIAWFMAGQCHEKLGDIDIACDCYLASVQMDDLAISAVERIHYLAPQLGNSALANWSTARLQELKQQQKQIASQPRTSYIPEASSGLKLAGEKALALS
jgi:tetratricopeptide (TPR) repeat protein